VVLIGQVILLLAAAATFDESYRAGLQALQQNHLAEARTQLENAAKAEPRKGRVWLALAQTYWKLQEPTKAVAAAETAASLASGDAQLLKLLAVYYSETGQWLKAGDVLVGYAAAAPDDRSATARILDCYLQAHAPERAIRAGTSAPDWERRADIRSLLGKAYAELNRPESAATEFQAAIRLSPYQESYYFDFANDLLQRQQFEPAIHVLEDARRNFDKSPQLELALGVALYGLRRYSEAATAFQTTIALSPDLEQPYLFLGRILDQIPDKLPELTRLFETFEKAHPLSYVGYLLHAKALLAQSSDSELPESLLKKSCSLNPKIAESHFELGVLLQRKRHLPEAAVEFEAAAAIDPVDPATHYHLAQVYERLGKTDAALSQRRRHAELMGAGKP